MHLSLNVHVNDVQSREMMFGVPALTSVLPLFTGLSHHAAAGCCQRAGGFGGVRELPHSGETPAAVGAEHQHVLHSVPENMSSPAAVSQDVCLVVSSMWSHRASSSCDPVRV